MNRNVYLVIGAAVTFVGASLMAARARADQSKTPIYLHFWRTNGDTAEMVDLTIPKVSAQCPEGFIPTDDPGYCGREVVMWVSLYYGGEQLNREQMQLRYSRSASGYFQPHVMVFRGLREIEVKPFYDANGLHHRVVGRLSVQFDHNTWRVRHRDREDTFFVETERGLPFLRLLECVTGEESRRASL